MSNSGKFKDYTPFIREAGVTSAMKDESVDTSLRQDLYFKPRSSTPESIRKYRKSTREVPGVKQLHHGVFNDPKDHERLVHGVKTKVSEHVDDCIKGQNLIGIQHFLNEIKEDKYARNHREPLGKSLRRDYIFPPVIQDNQFKFGIPTVTSHNAKDILYSARFMTDDPETKKKYAKTHGHTDPGEQKNREYKWPVDKTKFIFGKPQPIEIDGAKKSLRTDKLEADYPMTKLIDKRVEDFRQASSIYVGVPKFKGTMRNDLPPDFAFGVKTNIVFNAASCIRGGYAENDLLPDPDLGKSVLHRSKLKSIEPLKMDTNRIYGVPSIRHDLVKKVVSVSDQTNYGNEKDTYELLYPNPHAFKGLDNPDFEKGLTKEELKSVLISNKHEISEEDFDRIFEECLINSPNEGNTVRLKNFINTCRSLKREYNKYRIFSSYLQ